MPAQEPAHTETPPPAKFVPKPKEEVAFEPVQKKEPIINQSMTDKDYEVASTKLFDLTDKDKDKLIRFNEFLDLYMKMNPNSVLKN